MSLLRVPEKQEGQDKHCDVRKACTCGETGRFAHKPKEVTFSRFRGFRPKASAWQRKYLVVEANALSLPLTAAPADDATPPPVDLASILFACVKVTTGFL